MPFNYEDLINNLYCENKVAKDFLIKHSMAVRDFSLNIAKKFEVDINLVDQGAMIHDIGIIGVFAPSIDCHGKAPYIQHGIIGQKILQDLGQYKLASFCASHVGVAIKSDYIIRTKLDLPVADYVPQTLEEEIVAYADKFFSKKEEYLVNPKSLGVVLNELSRYGQESVDTFLIWHNKFCDK